LVWQEGLSYLGGSGEDAKGGDSNSASDYYNYLRSENIVDKPMSELFPHEADTTGFQQAFCLNLSKVLSDEKNGLLREFRVEMEFTSGTTVPKNMVGVCSCPVQRYYYRTAAHGWGVD
jgi:hypothetical protein